MDEEKQYIQAFNTGYILAEHEPHLVSTLFQNDIPNTNYWEGLLAGSEQLQIDIGKEQLLQIEKLRNQTRGNSKEIDRE